MVGDGMVAADTGVEPRAACPRHQARGDRTGALDPLERALALAEPEGHVRVFLDEGLAIAFLLGALARRGERV